VINRFDMPCPVENACPNFASIEYQTAISE
jgi:hypothetical protein